jgi:hypothetical protein
MSLDIKKVYVDTRWKTSDSKSDSDFSIELPRSFNVPDNVIAYIDDIILPVSFSSINENNNTLYFGYIIPGIETTVAIITIDPGNYTGASFAEALKTKLNLWGATKVPSGTAYVDKFNVTYYQPNNSIMITISDNNWILFVYCDADLKKGITPFYTIAEPKSLNNVLLINKSTRIDKASPFITVIDLHAIRNLYLTSSTLCAYNSISNFGNDTIIKKIPVKANYNEMLYHDSGSGFDYLDITPRTLRYIDFKLVDSYFNIVDLRNNHWSFSIIFAQK